MRILLSVLIVGFALAAHPAEPATMKIEVLTTTGGVRFGIWPGRPSQPAPVVIALSGQIESTLESPYFRQSGHFLTDKGFVLVSVDLPCHGLEVRRGEGAGLSGWKARASRGEDFVADVTAKLRKVLDHLIAEKIADPARVAALGTSRGGFIALHFAASDPRVKCALGFSPVTDLAALSEFRGASDLPLVKQLALENQAAALAGRAVWIVIGDRDQRVSTDKAVDLARRLTTLSLEKKLSPQVDLHLVAEPKGHTVPAGYARLGADWIEARFQTQAPTP